MHILLLRHYSPVEGRSMQSFAGLIANGLRSRGHVVESITAPKIFYRLSLNIPNLKKWLGYVDQFLVFPPFLWLYLRFVPLNTLLVACDQALGPWVPFLVRYPHIVHVHDLLALDASYGRQPFHRLGFSGRIYQRWIRDGFCTAKNFLSVSNATRVSLHSYLKTKPVFSKVLYNPLPKRFQEDIRLLCSHEASPIPEYVLPSPFVLHIGRNWYKNRLGVLMILEQVIDLGFNLNLVLVGSLEPALSAWLQRRPLLQDFVHVLESPSDCEIIRLYSHAECLLFPSHAEGFGWPILEAMACCCCVVTTNIRPMTEIGGSAPTYIPSFPANTRDQSLWARESAISLCNLIAQDKSAKDRIRKLGLSQVSLFNYSSWLDSLEAHYSTVLSSYSR